MCHFVETIRIDGGQATNLFYHEKRMNETLRRLFSDADGRRTTADNRLTAPRYSLADHLCLSPDMDNIKCRVVYGKDGISEITYSEYTIRPVRSLRLVCSDDIDYACKSTDRKAIDRLFGMRGISDDIIIVRRGLLTDTSIANIALFDGTVWQTPRLPLLGGTRRESLLDRGILQEKDITPDMLGSFSHIRLFNAMIDWGVQELPVEAVVR